MSDEKTTQENMDLGTTTGGVDSVEKYQFAPIKGYPMLNWRGKRPFTSSQYFPAQLKEVHGEEVEGWRNKIFWGDNLQVMGHLLKEFRGKVDLIYIDPPFDSRADYKKKIRLKGIDTTNDRNSFEEKQYTDIWSNDEYLQFMYERITLLRELLSDAGSFYLHCDQRVSSHLRLIMDEVLGADCFRSWIAWKSSPGHSDHSFYGPMQNHILFYSKGQSPIWNQQHQPYDEDYLQSHYQKRDPDGRRFEDDNATAYGLSGGGYEYEWNGCTKLWRYPQGTMERLHNEGRLYYTRNGVARYKRYLDEMPGNPLSDLWADISRLNSQALEKENYPTQKPVALLERIITASSKPGSIVLDCFAGSGTTQVAAMKLGRRFIGADINLGAIQTTTKRLIKIAGELKQNLPDSEKPFFTGFEVSNVNHYDVFRNPVQAKELLIEALEVQPLEMSTIFDGEKDGRMVKIMPVQRLTTRADLNELIAGFDYKAWERRQGENPNRAVEKITLVCMGHEPDLSAHLILAAKPYKIDVEVVDILRDKADLEFKRDSDAKVVVKDGELVIERFYPMNLLQKLSMQKEAVDDWRELTESILIDWNYDGAVLQPAVVDIPEKKTDLVIGRYNVPADAGTVRVKITDLLSESWEGSVTNG
ncbi:MAG: site-specific DNA-methyltransferase [Alphaproteobacteria bacterium]|nr:site-specific DNA-methyltransferase [Alphaproteobacteria bacterium]